MDSRLTPEPESDRKLTLLVAGSVVTGALCILLLAGLAMQDDNRTATASAARDVATALDAGSGATLGAALEADPADGVEVPRGADPPALEITIDPAADPWQAGLAAFGTRDYALAAAYFGADALRRPDQGYTHYMHGLALWKSGSLDGAIEALARSADLNDGSIRTFVNLARVRLERGEPEAALLAAERGLEIDPDSAQALYQQARALHALERDGDAIAVLERCVELDPAAGQAHNLLGLIRLRSGEWTAALPSLEAAAALLPETAYAQNNYGLALERAGRFDEAAVAFRRAIEADAGHAAAELSLARVAAHGPEAGSPPLELASAATEPSGVSAEPQPLEPRDIVGEPASD